MALAFKKLEVLSQNDLYKIHNASIKILKETGVVFQSEETREIFKKHGAKVFGETVYIPEHMVESALETCPSTFKQWGRNPANSILLGKKQKGVAVSTQNGSVYVQDLDKGRRRGTTKDYIKITKLCQESDVVKVVGGIPTEPIDLGAKKRHLEIIYLLLKHTDKPLLGINGSQREMREMFDMLEIAMGKNDYLLEHAMIAVAVDPLSPLRYDFEPCETILAYAKNRQPVYINSCVQAGTTGPISLLGTVTLMNTEILAGLTLIQLVNPGSPVVYVSGSTVSNMKNASFITGSPEGHLIVIAGLQMAMDLYCLPSRAMAGITDAKTVNCQAGYETMQNLLMCMLAGVNFINNSLGCLDSIMTTSYEKLIIDEEMIKRVIRIREGISGTDDNIAWDVIQEVAHSGLYLVHQHTFDNFKERWRPIVSEWDSYSDWEENGAVDVAGKANRKYKEILQNSPDSLIDEELDKELQTFLKSKS